jgi:hypothetical protein
MPYLSTQQLAVIRRITEKAMKDVCRIERLANAVGTMGQPLTDAWEVVSEDVPCRLITSKGATLPATDVYADRITLEDTYTISLPVGTTLAADYRITINTTTWRVASVLDGRTDAADVQAVLLRMRQE